MDSTNPNPAGPLPQSTDGPPPLVKISPSVSESVAALKITPTSPPPLRLITPPSKVPQNKFSPPPLVSLSKPENIIKKSSTSSTSAPVLKKSLHSIKTPENIEYSGPSAVIPESTLPLLKSGSITITKLTPTGTTKSVEESSKLPTKVSSESSSKLPVKLSTQSSSSSKPPTRASSTSTVKTTKTPAELTAKSPRILSTESLASPTKTKPSVKIASFAKAPLIPVQSPLLAVNRPGPSTNASTSQVRTQQTCKETPPENQACDEDEYLVYMQFDAQIDDDLLQPETAFKIIGIDTDQPFLQLGNQIYKGEWRDTIGTALFFEEEKDIVPGDPVFTKTPPCMLKYHSKTRKSLQMSRIFVKPKDGESKDTPASQNTSSSASTSETATDELRTSAKNSVSVHL